MSTLLRRAILSATAMLLAFSVACGGGDAAPERQRLSAADWVADVCAKANDYDDAQSEAIRPLAEADEGDPAQLREAIESMVRNSQFAAADFLDAVERVGAPDIAHAEAVMDAFRAHEEQQREVLGRFKSDVNKLDTTDTRYNAKVLALVETVEHLDFRARLEAIGEADVDDLIGLIDADAECSFILFPK